MTRVAIITGSAQGIGHAIALRLARDGFNIVINDLPSQLAKLEQLQKEIGIEKCIIVTGDISNEDDVKILIDKTVDELGGLDVMVANAGINRVLPFLDRMLSFTHLSVNIDRHGRPRTTNLQDQRHRDIPMSQIRCICYD